MSLEQVDAARARFEATLRAAPLNLPADTGVDAFVISSADVADLVREIKRLRSRYFVLEAACRAGLLAAVENDSRPAPLWVLDSPWLYVTDALAAPPVFHPLADVLPLIFWGGEQL
ncbi:hypothetical protein F1D05_31610 [Kribbella qitaiheensis]|uniref:Uncharacterized protein n=1 Tax=Kribbella qitaiheensis TaxID=1544730 RepID=A0A7G6WYW2_9ACTN|nr:hypothetical protein [Kribbella qitaiheensis]QNE18385.1 hypothetical protein F1D05_11365 [Kribbella qitaiheensis]QNE19177.1 hypothetical protein F1D05_16225 [Kribbella qitaiheensis]QNE21638.1 hypothetical protein F1D05_31610 [Kribbella qitaiheensis]